MKEKSTDKIQIRLEPDETIVYIHWTEACKNILDEDITDELTQVSEIQNATNALGLLVDLSNCVYHDEPGKQPWFDNPVYSDYLNLGFQKIAFVVPENLFQQAAFEANKLSLKDTDQKNIQFFKDPGKAELFLKNKNM
jgi:hypothetical protein